MSQNPNPEQAGHLNVEIPEDVAEGQYSNLVFITHSNAEFVVDFIKMMPGMPKARVKSRIILTPQHAKRFVRALTENIGQYEATFGPIQEIETVHGIPMNFGGEVGQA
ncbi:MAG: DUF3467 domain-containing protein [Flavobacteriales bacterium]|nr:DUF3467 domain-containing protein [Flavobacteriales bacterium]MCX7768589.1 DUF3467 domain-containing protein [Flavobacteriales bacterium]MDW8409757.1 DUF3467 domain-containing protein [Flavobacteriales bacterium]